MYSSPYLRCLQTSAGVIEGLRGTTTTRIEVREELSEIQNGKSNQEADIAKLSINQYSETEAFKKEFLPESQHSVNICYMKNYDGKPEEWPQFKMSYPESLEAFYQRYL